MRILHTADWHLNDRLGRIDRTADLRAGVERIAGYCQSERIDVLAIAGDLFSELARPDALRETVKHWQECFSPFLSRGGTILAVTGNHDSETFCQTLRHAMSLAAGEPIDGRIQPGRFHLATKPTHLILRDSAGFDVSFALMPWPTATQYPDAVVKAATPEEKTKKLSQAFAQALAAMPVKSPAVLIAHVNVTGATIGQMGFRLSEQDNISIEATDIAKRFQYAAFGHVHKPQSIGGHEHVRYSGSLDRMDLGERHDQKSCVVVEVGPQGLTQPLQFLPLPSQAIYPIVITDPATDLPRLKEEYPDADQDLVQLVIRYEAGRDRLEEVLAEASALFPRWYARDWKEVSALGPTLVAADEPDRTKGYEQTVREYVGQELIQHPITERDTILALLEEILPGESS